MVSIENVRGKLEGKDGVTELKSGTGARGPWTLYGGKVTVKGKDYNLKAEFKEEKVEDMLSGLVVGDTVNLTIETDDKGYRNVIVIETVKDDGNDTGQADIIKYSETKSGRERVVKRKVIICKVEDIESELIEIDKEKDVFATQPVYRSKHDDFVLICYYRE